MHVLLYIEFLLLHAVKITAFYLTLYTFLSAFFVAHLFTYLFIIGPASQGRAPNNFAQYGYFSYPNSKLREFLQPTYIHIFYVGGVYVCSMYTLYSTQNCYSSLLLPRSCVHSWLYQSDKLKGIHLFSKPKC